MLRAVLANAPNSIPPERVFSILNDTFDDDQDRALADYLEFALQRQYQHARPRRVRERVWMERRSEDLARWPVRHGRLAEREGNVESRSIVNTIVNT